jgi:hypothetical protein
VVAAARKGRGEIREQTAAVVEHVARLPVHELAGWNDRPAERGRDRLVPEAHAEDRTPPEETIDELAEDRHLLRPAGPRREHQVARPNPFGRRPVDGIAPADDHGRAERPERLHEVPGERVEAVDQENRRAHAVS